MRHRRWFVLPLGRDQVVAAFAMRGSVAGRHQVATRQFIFDQQARHQRHAQAMNRSGGRYRKKLETRPKERMGCCHPPSRQTIHARHTAACFAAAAVTRPLLRARVRWLARSSAGCTPAAHPLASGPWRACRPSCPPARQCWREAPHQARCRQTKKGGCGPPYEPRYRGGKPAGRADAESASG